MTAPGPDRYDSVTAQRGQRCLTTIDFCGVGLLRSRKARVGSGCRTGMTTIAQRWMIMRNGFKRAGVLALGALLLGVSACSQGSTTKTPDAGGSQSSGPANIKIAYQQFGPGTVMKNF